MLELIKERKRNNWLGHWLRRNCPLKDALEGMVNGKKVRGRKIYQKIDIQIKGESIKKVDSFKYLGCNISTDMNCCQEVKQRIAMAKEAFNRKRSIFCGSLEKELRKRLVNYFVWSVAVYGAETWDSMTE